MALCNIYSDSDGQRGTEMGGRSKREQNRGVER